jgi:ribosomal protein L14E/L6E/L27E
MVQSFMGRPALHGIDEKTGQERTVLLSDVQLFEAKRRKPEVSRVVRTEAELVETDDVEVREVEVTITAAELVERPDAAGAAMPAEEVREESAQA